MAADNQKPLVEPKPQTKTNGSRKSVAPDGTSWSEWDAHDQAWHTAKLIELGITKPPEDKSIHYCMTCGLEPVRSKTSDYCSTCWERRSTKQRENQNPKTSGGTPWGGLKDWED